MELLHNRLLTQLHLLIREYALIVRMDEDEAKKKIKQELKIESFGKIEEKEIAKACGIVEMKISEEIEKQKHANQSETLN